MKRIIFTFVLTLLFTVCAFAQDGVMRTWTDVEGHQVNGIYVSLSSDREFIRLRIDGKARRWRLENFSDADLVFIGKQGEEEREVVLAVRPHLADVLPRSAPISPNHNEDEIDNAKTIRVIRAKGVGETPEEARKVALSSAVQEAAGTFVNTKTHVNNDEVMQQILTYSGAYVETSKVISTSQKDGLYTVIVLAKIRKTSVTEKINFDNSKVFPLEGSQLADKLNSKFRSERDGVRFLANFLWDERFPYSCIECFVSSKPIVENDGYNIKLTYYWGVRVNTVKYTEFIRKLVPILEKTAVNKISYTLEKMKSGKWAVRYIDSHPTQITSKYYLDVCVASSNLQQSMVFYRYELPKQYFVLFSYCRRIVPTIEITLIDENKYVVDSKKDYLVYSYHRPYDYAIFNMMYTLADRRDIPLEASGSVLLPACQLTPFCILPCVKYPNDDGIGILNTLIGRTSFYMSRETLSRLKLTSAKIHYRNAGMEAIYQNMDILLEVPSSID